MVLSREEKTCTVKSGWRKVKAQPQNDKVGATAERGHLSPKSEEKKGTLLCKLSLLFKYENKKNILYGLPDPLSFLL